MPFPVIFFAYSRSGMAKPRARNFIKEDFWSESDEGTGSQRNGTHQLFEPDGTIFGKISNTSHSISII